MTAVSVMQCVEKGLLDLDADVSSILHEFKNPDILTGFEDGTGKPILVRATNKITLRLLLSHSSGLCLSMMDPRLIQWAKWEGKHPPKRDESIVGANAMFHVPIVASPLCLLLLFSTVNA
jgi:CubicO group peptidase (beta-lactamase class C family)